MRFICMFLLILSTSFLMAQNKTGGVRGSVYDEATGEPMPFVTIYLDGTNYNASSNIDGDYTITNVPAGEYVLKIMYLGFDSMSVDIKIPKGKMITQNVLLKEAAEQIGTVDVSAEREAERNDVRVSVTRITPKDIRRIPAAGGEADLAQYLQVIPGVVFTGDQGGQLYIRGGAPIQNQILLDGMPIYNAFHSIGFFSVFETDIIRSADVYTGGFSAKYGGRSSAVIDIKTRAGNKKRFAGMLNANPFVVKGIFEGPIIKMKKDNGSSLSFLLTAKHSYLDQTSKLLYSYANEQGGLPYSFTDIYGKISFNGAGGSRLNAFGFYFRDGVDFENIATYNWQSGGAGVDFRIVPKGAKVIMDGTLAFSQYSSKFIEGDTANQRSSTINSFTADLNMTYFLAKSRQLNFGLEVKSPLTNFQFSNSRGIPYSQEQSNVEAALYARFKGRFGPLVIEPSVRAQFYASLGEARFEPRLGLKWNITEFLRLKAAGGMYSQNMISSVDERDIVNLFVGFLGGPDDGVYKIVDGQYMPQKSRLQTSYHIIGGVEANIGKYVTLNLEPYWKHFPQIISLNRNRVDADDKVVFIAEKGDAYGLDFSGKFEKDQLYLYAAYSLGYVNRDDGVQQFSAHFDRRHNVNVVASYNFRIGKEAKPLDENAPSKIERPTKHPFEVSLRWNMGSGFPFTLTQGFFQLQTFKDGISTNYLTDNTSPNTELGILYEEQINQGRLPFYHRLDFSLKYTFDLFKHMKLSVAASVTNAYNRENIFYFDRVTYDRVNQLPILPALNIALRF
ncbi:MAG: TonB-dependent receptor plug domain-containing protein [Aureispira sp.]|nr:TonB-dependent receptor plug domain-containing protein [Aureispira sp.]